MTILIVVRSLAGTIRIEITPRCGPFPIDHAALSYTSANRPSSCRTPNRDRRRLEAWNADQPDITGTIWEDRDPYTQDASYYGFVNWGT
jgi:hypothetical protein